MTGFIWGRANVVGGEEGVGKPAIVFPLPPPSSFWRTKDIFLVMYILPSSPGIRNGWLWKRKNEGQRGNKILLLIKSKVEGNLRTKEF